MTTLFWTEPPKATRSDDGRRWAGTRQYAGQEDADSLNSEEEEEEAQGTEMVLTSLTQDVYGACLVLTVRGLYEQKLGTILMAWCWVILSIALNLIIAQSLHNYVNHVSSYDTTRVLQFLATELQGHLANNTAPSTNRTHDRKLIDFCEHQPSSIFFFAVHFIWSSRMLGQLSQARTMLLNMICCPVCSVRSMTIQEQDGNIRLTGLMPFDTCFFGILLVLPKTLVAVLLWYVGTEVLALTRDLGRMLFKAVVLYYISTCESEVFENFLSHSKREWICRTEMLQERGRLSRLAISWPGEVLKLLTAVSFVFFGRYLFSLRADVRELCFKCVHTCTAKCSQAFTYCTNLEAWPYHYNEH